MAHSIRFDFESREVLKLLLESSLELRSVHGITSSDPRDATRSCMSWTMFGTRGAYCASVVRVERNLWSPLLHLPDFCLPLTHSSPQSMVHGTLKYSHPCISHLSRWTSLPEPYACCTQENNAQRERLAAWASRTQPFHSTVHLLPGSWCRVATQGIHNARRRVIASDQPLDMR